MMPRRIKNDWTRFWMHYAGLSRFGRLATRLATWFTPPYCGRCYLARLNQNGYIAPSAAIHHDGLSLGKHVFIGDGVIIYRDQGGGPVELGDYLHLYGETYIQTGQGGSVKMGHNTHIQPKCQFSAYMASIEIGSYVQIAPNCGFYPYNHGVVAGKRIIDQPLHTKGSIIVEDDAWLGFGVVVLDGVRIGKGAVVGAGSVVTQDIPEGAIAAGVPARVLKMRRDLSTKSSERG